MILQINPDANFPNPYIKLVVDGQAHIITVNPINPTNTALPMQQYIEQNLSDKLKVYPIESSTAIGLGNNMHHQNIRLELGAGSDLGYGVGYYSGICCFANGAGFTDPDHPNPTIIEENELGASTVCLGFNPTYEFESSVYNTDFVRIEPDGSEIDSALIEILMQQADDTVVEKTLQQWLQDSPDNFTSSFDENEHTYGIQIADSDNDAIWKYVRITSTQPFFAEVIGS